MEPPNENKLRVLVVAAVISLIILSALVTGSIFSFDTISEEEELCIEFVKIIYHYNSPEELVDNMERLQKITVPAVYNAYTVNAPDNVLSKYLKFKGEPVHVEIINSSEDHVMFKLDTPYISNTRTFMIVFEVEDGVITSATEMECIIFNEL